jgi:hypothetical protein
MSEEDNGGKGQSGMKKREREKKMAERDERRWVKGVMESEEELGA